MPSLSKEAEKALDFASTILSPYFSDISKDSLRTMLENTDVVEGFEQRYKIKDVAIKLNCSVKHVWNLIERGKLTPCRNFGVTRIKHSELMRLSDK